MRDIASGIAVIGMACRFPGAPTVEQFWRNLKQGRESITFFDEDELEPDVRALSRDPAYVRAGAIIDDIDLFDAAFFKMSPREATLTDPQHRLFLECAWTALEAAGYGDCDARGAVVGCYAGSWASSYAARAAGQVATPADEFQALVGGGLDYLTTLVSYKLNLTGESVAVQTACSTSLVAVHYACQSLLNGDIDMALAGGVSIDARQKTGYLYQDGMIFSPDGHCRPFDRQAKGTVRGYGLGLVVLKRLEDAVRDRDHIHAVIRRTAVNNDGQYKIGYTAPSGRGQTDVITTAMVYADVRADSIGYVETHGTGTPLGDPIEIEALARAFGTSESVRPRSCAIGSVKSNFGHLVEAAGVAGLIKTIASLEHGEIPATLHFKDPNPRIDFARTPFFVADRTMPWPIDGPRRASVSSFGIGGTNAHAVLEAWTPPPAASAPPGFELITLSADNAEALALMRAQLAEWLAIHLEAQLGDIAFTLNTGRHEFRHRWACVAATKHELLRALDPGDEEGDDDEERSGVRPMPSGWAISHVADLAPTRARFRPVLPVDPGSLQSLALKWSHGDRIDFRPLYENRTVRRIPLPTYPFQRKRFWLDPPARTTGPRGFGPWLGQATAGASAAEPSAARSELLLLAGETEELLRRRAAACRALAAGDGGPSLSAVCQVASSQAAGTHRLAAVARTREELVSLLDLRRASGEGGRLLRSSPSSSFDPLPELATGSSRGSASDLRGSSASSRRARVSLPRLAFVFSGQGGQWWGMGRELLAEEPVFRRTLEACGEVLDRWIGTRFMSIWRAREASSPINDPDIAQPAIVALQIGLAALWRSWGIVPDCVVGQSLGEIAAAHVAGALSFEDALAVAHHRSRLMKRVAGRGRTAAVELPMAEALRAIAGYEEHLGVAGSNAPTASVLSGSPEALEEVLGQLRARGVFCRELRIDIAFHSPQMEPLVPELLASLANLRPRTATVPIYSTVEAALIDGARLDARYWARNLREPFRFAAAIERMALDGHERFLELGPHPVLSHAVEQALQHLGREATVLPSLHRERPDRDIMLRSLGALFVAGHPVTWPPLDAAVTPEHDTEEMEVLAFPESPRSTAERVRALVAEVLLAKPGDLADDVALVDLGMDSVTGLSLIGKLAAAFDVRLDTGELLRLRTIGGIAKRLESGGAAGLTAGTGERARPGARVPIRSARDPRADVVLFPGAGGTALMLAPWATAGLLDGASVSAMDPPGHGSDRRPPLRRMTELVDLYVSSLLPAERPLVLVGYSLGGLVAFAVAHALERLGAPPGALVVSHTLPPPVWRELMFSRDGKFEETFGALYEAWGIDSQSRARFLDAARADFQAAESFEPPPGRLAALTCIISGAADDFAPANRMRGWDMACERPVHYTAAGGHWDFLEHPANRDLLRTVYARACQSALAPAPAPWPAIEVAGATGARRTREYSPG